MARITAVLLLLTATAQAAELRHIRVLDGDTIVANIELGFDVVLQFCVDPVDNGALSSCPAGEGHTWGKVSADCVENSSVYVHCDMTPVFPWLVYALFNGGAQRPLRRLYSQLDEARAQLHAEVASQREDLLAMR